MPFNGSGVFGPIAAPDFPAVSGTIIRAAQFNNNLTDVFSGLTLCITRDGQSPAQANLPMAGFKHTGVGLATASDQYATLGQVMSSAHLIAGVGGTTTAYTGTVSGLAAYAAGQYFWFTPNATNTGASTLNINGIGARSIHKRGGTDVAANQLFTGTPFLLYYTGSQFRILGDGGTILGAVSGSSSGPSINIPHGTAPSSPNNGDMWSTTANLFMRINGVTQSNAWLEAANIFTTDQTIQSAGPDLTITTLADAQQTNLNLGTAGINMWTLYKTATANSGSNAGSDLELISRTDAGAGLVNVFSVKRSTGNSIFGSTALNDDGVNRLQVRGYLGIIDSAPRWHLFETDAPANEGLWRCLASAGDLTWQTGTDAYGGFVTFMSVNRTGTTVDAVNLTGTAITLNGAVTATTFTAGVVPYPTTDPGADRIIFWDDSATQATYLAMPAAGLTISGTSLALANDLAALEGLGSTGFAVRTAADTWAQRSIAAGTGMAVSNGDGVAGNPSVSLSHLGIQSLTDPNADRIMFWDDSAGAAAWLSLGTGVSISGTVLSANGVTISAIKSATTSRASTGIPAVDPDLTISGLENGATYKVELLLGVTSGAGGFRGSIVTTGGNNRAGIADTGDAGTTIGMYYRENGALADFCNTAVTIITGSSSVNFIFTATSGTNSIALHWSQAASNVANTNVHTGSSLIVTKISA